MFFKYNSYLRTVVEIVDIMNNNSNECAICLENMNNDIENNTIMALPTCKHQFHVECFFDYMKRTTVRNEVNCPVCRNLLFKLPVVVVTQVTPAIDTSMQQQMSVWDNVDYQTRKVAIIMTSAMMFWLLFLLWGGEL